jgi:hypothetical protein
MGNLQPKPKLETKFGSNKRKPKKKPKGKCKTYLEQKIALSLAEYKKGNYQTRQQAIAVAYSQVRKKHPRCKQFLTTNKNNN